MSKNISKSKKVFLISGIILAFILVLVLFANIIVSRIAEKKVRDMLVSQPDMGYEISFKKLKVNLFTMSVTIEDIRLMPDSVLMKHYKSHSSTQKTLYKAEIPILKLAHLDLFSILGSKLVKIREVKYDKAAITLYTGGGKRVKHQITQEELDKGINISRIRMSGIGGVDIGGIKLIDLSVFLVNPISGDTLLNNRDIDFELHNLYLVKNISDSNSFHLDMKDLRFEIENEHFELTKGGYHLSFKECSFNAKSHKVHINKLMVKPVEDIYRTAAGYQYRTDVYNAEAEHVMVELGDIKTMLITGNYYLPRIHIDGLNLFIVRNISLPFDESRRPLLPNQLLQELKTDLDIDSLLISHGILVYEESNNNREPSMKVSLDRLRVEISEITSIRDSMSYEYPMQIRLMADLQNQLALDVTFKYPLLSRSDTFTFSGSLGGGDITVFNPMLESAANVRFLKGKLKGIHFSVQANATHAMGQMTMLYSGLDGEVLKKDTEEGNKFLSWLANQVVKSDNPLNGEEPRVVPIYFKRVMYKGAGNFAFKALLSGILASTIPTFDHANQKSIDVVKKETKKDKRQLRREERREERREGCRDQK